MNNMKSRKETSDKRPHLYYTLVQRFRANYIAHHKYSPESNKGFAESEKLITNPRAKKESAFHEMCSFFDELLRAIKSETVVPQKNSQQRLTAKKSNTPIQQTDDQNSDDFKQDNETDINRYKIIEDKLKILAIYEKSNPEKFHNTFQQIAARNPKSNSGKNSDIRLDYSFEQFKSEILNIFMVEIALQAIKEYYALIQRYPRFSTRPSGDVHLQGTKEQMDELLRYAESGNFYLIILKAIRNIEELQIALLENELADEDKRFAEAWAKILITRYQKWINTAGLFLKQQHEEIEKANKQKLENAASATGASQTKQNELNADRLKNTKSIVAAVAKKVEVKVDSVEKEYKKAATLDQDSDPQTSDEDTESSSDSSSSAKQKQEDKLHHAQENLILKIRINLNKIYAFNATTNTQVINNPLQFLEICKTILDTPGAKLKREAVLTRDEIIHHFLHSGYYESNDSRYIAVLQFVKDEIQQKSEEAFLNEILFDIKEQGFEIVLEPDTKQLVFDVDSSPANKTGQEEDSGDEGANLISFMADDSIAADAQIPKKSNPIRLSKIKGGDSYTKFAAIRNHPKLLQVLLDNCNSTIDKYKAEIFSLNLGITTTSTQRETNENKMKITAIEHKIAKIASIKAKILSYFGSARASTERLLNPRFYLENNPVSASPSTAPKAETMKKSQEDDAESKKNKTIAVKKAQQDLNKVKEIATNKLGRAFALVANPLDGSHQAIRSYVDYNITGASDQSRHNERSHRATNLNAIFYSLRLKENKKLQDFKYNEVYLSITKEGADNYLNWETKIASGKIKIADTNMPIKTDADKNAAKNSKLITKVAKAVEQKKLENPSLLSLSEGEQFLKLISPPYDLSHIMKLYYMSNQAMYGQIQLPDSFPGIDGKYQLNPGEIIAKWGRSYLQDRIEISLNSFNKVLNTYTDELEVLFENPQQRYELYFQSHFAENKRIEAYALLAYTQEVKKIHIINTFLTKHHLQKTRIDDLKALMTSLTKCKTEENYLDFLMEAMLLIEKSEGHYWDNLYETTIATVCLNVIDKHMIGTNKFQLNFSATQLGYVKELIKSIAVNKKSDLYSQTVFALEQQIKIKKKNDIEGQFNAFEQEKSLRDSQKGNSGDQSKIDEKIALFERTIINGLFNRQLAKKVMSTGDFVLKSKDLSFIGAGLAAGITHLGLPGGCVVQSIFNAADQMAQIEKATKLDNEIFSKMKDDSKNIKEQMSTEYGSLACWEKLAERTAKTLSSIFRKSINDMTLDSAEDFAKLYLLRANFALDNVTEDTLKELSLHDFMVLALWKQDIKLTKIPFRRDHYETEDKRANMTFQGLIENIVYVETVEEPTMISNESSKNNDKIDEHVNIDYGSEKTDSPANSDQILVEVPQDNGTNHQQGPNENSDALTSKFQFYATPSSLGLYRHTGKRFEKEYNAKTDKYGVTASKEFSDTLLLHTGRNRFFIEKNDKGIYEGTLNGNPIKPALNERVSNSKTQAKNLLDQATQALVKGLGQ